MYVSHEMALASILSLPVETGNLEWRLKRPGVDVMITIFSDFWQFSAKKLAFFSKTNVIIKILHNLPSFVLSQKRQFFRRNNLNNHNIGLRNRVTRLCEFSPTGWLLTRGSFLKMTEVAQIYIWSTYLFSVMFLILAKMGWATFWAICSQTHMVTLIRRI
jgi:hypothetical protein